MMASSKIVKHGSKKRKFQNTGPINTMKKPKTSNKKEAKTDTKDNVFELDVSLIKTESETEPEKTNNSHRSNISDDSLRNINIISSPSKRRLQGANNSTFCKESTEPVNRRGETNSNTRVVKQENRSTDTDIISENGKKGLRNKNNLEPQEVSEKEENSRDMDFMINEDNTVHKNADTSSLRQFGKYSDKRSARDSNGKQQENIIVQLTDDEDEENNRLLAYEKENIDKLKKKEVSDVKVIISFTKLKIIDRNINGNYNGIILNRNEDNKFLGASFTENFFVLMLNAYSIDEIDYKNVKIFSYKTDFQRIILEFEESVIFKKKNITSDGSLHPVQLLRVECIEFSPNTKSQSQLKGILNAKIRKRKPDLIVNENFDFEFQIKFHKKYRIGDENYSSSLSNSLEKHKNSRPNSLKDKQYNSLTKPQSLQNNIPSFSKRGNKISSPSLGINKATGAETITHKESRVRDFQNGISPTDFFGKSSSDSARGSRKLEDMAKLDEEKLKTSQDNAKSNRKAFPNSGGQSQRLTRSQTGSLSVSKKRSTEYYDDTEYESTHPLDKDLKHFFSDGTSLRIQDKDFQCLFNGQWLNGSLIDFFNKFFKDEVLKLQITPKLEDLQNITKDEDILNVADITNDNPEEPKVKPNNDFYIFSSYFFLTLDNLEKVVKSRWLLKDDCAVMKNHKYHIIPINLNYHWFGCILEDFYKKCLETASIIKEFEQKQPEPLKEENVGEDVKVVNEEQINQEKPEGIYGDTDLDKNSSTKKRSTRLSLRHILSNNKKPEIQNEPLKYKSKDLPKITIYVFDSLRNTHHKGLQPIKDFLILFAERNFNVKLLPGQLKMKNSQVIKQPNMNDCGVHLISNIKSFMKHTEKTLGYWNSCNFVADNAELISFFKETYIKTSRKPLRDTVMELLEIAKTGKDPNNIALDPIRMDSNDDADDELVIIEKNSPKKKRKLNREEDENKNEEIVILKKMTDLQLEEGKKRRIDEELNTVFGKSDVENEAEVATNLATITSNLNSIKNVTEKSNLSAEEEKNESQHPDKNQVNEVHSDDGDGDAGAKHKNEYSNTSKFFDKKKSKLSVSSGLLKDRKESIGKISKTIGSSNLRSNEDENLHTALKHSLLRSDVEGNLDKTFPQELQPILRLKDASVERRHNNEAIDLTNEHSNSENDMSNTKESKN